MLIEVAPADSYSMANQVPTFPLFRRGVEETGKPDHGSDDFTPVRKNNPQTFIVQSNADDRCIDFNLQSRHPSLLEKGFMLD
jgi:hypothetical protein